MKNMYIFGNSGFAMEVAQVIIDNGQYDVCGFIEADDAFDNLIDDRFHMVKGLRIPIISESSFQRIIPDVSSRPSCVIAISDAAIADKIFVKFSEVVDFPNIISKNASVNDTEILGVGNIIFPGSWISWSVALGSFNKILPFVTIGHECVIGDFNQFNPKVSIGGKVKIGNANLFGMNSMVYQGKSIGNRNTIGMGSGVIRNVKSNQTLYGNPAKIIQSS